MAGTFPLASSYVASFEPSIPHHSSSAPCTIKTKHSNMMGSSSKRVLAVMMLSSVVACLAVGAMAGIPSGKVIELTENNFDEMVRERERERHFHSSIARRHAQHFFGFFPMSATAPLLPPTTAPTKLTRTLLLTRPASCLVPLSFSRPVVIFLFPVDVFSCRWRRAPSSSMCTRSGADVRMD